MDPRDLINQNVRRMVEAENSRMEMLVLAGCNRCGKRLMDGDRPINGAHFLRWPMGANGECPIEAVCGDCFPHE